MQDQGITAAIYGARAMAKIAMIEKAPGGKNNKTSEIENYPGLIVFKAQI